MKSRSAFRPSPSRVIGHAWLALALGGVLSPCLADGVQPLTQSDGPPNLPIPVFPETGLPDFTMPVGTPSVAPPPPDGTGTGTTPTGGTPADDVLASRSWGAAAAANAQTMGVNASALAATCIMESGCQNIGGPGSASGAFQMTDATYTQDIKQALAQNPSLAGTIDTSLAGKMDPANQSIAASQNLIDASNALKSAGVSNPTFLDTRGYYQWGAAPGPQIAKADDTQNMAELLSAYYTPAQMASNGVTASTTVGQWRQGVIDRVGAVATQKVLT